MLCYVVYAVLLEEATYQILLLILIHGLIPVVEGRVNSAACDPARDVDTLLYLAFMTTFLWFEH